MASPVRFLIPTRRASFRHAWHGLRWFARHEGNARTHLVATVGVVVAGAVLRVPGGDWCWLIAAIVAVWTAETFNTAIEQLADEVSMEPRERIRRCKDIASGAVLLAAVGAAAIGLVVLGPPLWRWLT